MGREWSTMSWADKYKLVYHAFGSVNSDCGADELFHIWGQVQERNLCDAYIAALAGLLGITSPAYTPADVMALMLADEDTQWRAALRAAGVEV